MQIVKALLQSKALSGLDFNLDFLFTPSLFVETKEENKMTVLFCYYFIACFVFWNINCANIFSNYIKARQGGKRVDVIRGLRRELTAFRLMNSIKEIKDEHFVFWRYDRCIIKKPLSKQEQNTSALTQNVCCKELPQGFKKPQLQVPILVSNTLRDLCTFSRGLLDFWRWFDSWRFVNMGSNWGHNHCLSCSHQSIAISDYTSRSDHWLNFLLIFTFQSCPWTQKGDNFFNCLFSLH